MIAVVGEALVDLAVATDGTITAHLGGGPFNTARALGRLGVPVRYVGRLSTDAFGRRLEAALVDDGVDVAMAVTTDDPTTLALAQLDALGAASYRFYVDGTSVPGLEPADVGRLVDEPPAALHVGTLGLVLEPLAQTTEALVSALAGRSLVVLDPNVRPSILRDPDGYRARLDRVAVAADVVKVSEDDLAWLSPGVQASVAAQRFLDLGARVVLVTLGGQGALVVGPTFEVHVPAPPVTVADTIGAGDAFTGGVLCWWHEHGQPDLGGHLAAVAATRFGAQVAALTVARSGASPPRRDEVGQ